MWHIILGILILIVGAALGLVMAFGASMSDNPEASVAAGRETWQVLGVFAVAGAFVIWWPL